MGNGDYGQFITCCLCHSFLLMLFPCSSVGSLPRQTILRELTDVAPSHGLQFFRNCSSVGPSHRVQPFKNRLLQHESPPGSQVLPANLLQHGLLFPWGHRSCQEPAPAQVLRGVTAFFGHIHLLWHGVPSTGCRWISNITNQSTRWSWQQMHGRPQIVQK